MSQFQRIISAYVIMTILLGVWGITGLAVEEGTVMFSDNFSSLSVGAKVTVDGSNPHKWTAKAESATSLLLGYDDGGNMVLRISNDLGDKTGGPRLEKRIDITDMTNMTITYRAKANGCNAQVQLWSDGVANKTLLSYGQNSWADLKIVLDFEQGSYSTYINNTVNGQNQSYNTITDTTTFTLRFTQSVDPGDEVFLDDVVISTTDDVVIEQILLGDGRVNFDKVRVVTDTPLVPYLREHPRLFLNSFDPIRQKISTNANYTQWYQNVKSTANSYLTVSPPEYDLDRRENILIQSRTIMQRVYTLAFVYNIERDTKYLNRAMVELEAACAYPDWTPNEFLSTAEMMNGFAVAYDWLYYDLTQEQKNFLMTAIMEKGVSPLIYNYEGVLTGGTNWVKTTINWNPVCNGGSVIAALGMISDQYPNVAEYMLHKAAASIPNGLKPYAPDGAYPEGIGYWGYGTKYLIYTMATLDSALADGISLPDKFIYYDKPGIAETAEFPIYYNGPVSAFNFGDAGSARTNSSTLYWFAKKYNKPQYAWHQKKVEQELNKTLSGMEGVFALLWYDADDSDYSSSFGLDKAYNAPNKHNGVILRSAWDNPNAMYAGLQGGRNSDNHMYLSLGTFVLESNGKRWITMRGTGDYDYPGYFSSSTADSPRWTYYVARAEGQNTMIANPGYPADQVVDATAQVVAFESATNEAFGVLDMTQTNTSYTDAKRGMFMTNNRNKLIIQDEIKTNQPSEIWWFAHTGADVNIAADGKSAILTIDKGTSNEKRMWVHIAQGPTEAQLTVMNAVPLPSSPNPSVQTLNYGRKLAINLHNISNLTLAVEFIPLKSGEVPPTQQTLITPISTWHVTNPKPAPPQELTVDDITNTIVGLNLETMEYAVSTDGGVLFGEYTSSSVLSLGGNKVVKVRIKAQGTTPASDDVVLEFTANAGDVDGDGMIAITDVIMTAEIAVGYPNYTAEQIERANVSSKMESIADISDVVLIIERVVGTANLFPVELP